MARSRQNMLKNKANLIYKISALDKVIEEISTSGTASASLSASGGSQSYTHADLDKLLNLRRRYVGRVEQINMALSALPNATGIRHVMTIRCGGIW